MNLFFNRFDINCIFTKRYFYAPSSSLNHSRDLNSPSPVFFLLASHAFLSYFSLRLPFVISEQNPFWEMEGVRLGPGLLGLPWGSVLLVVFHRICFDSRDMYRLVIHSLSTRSVLFCLRVRVIIR